MSVCLNVLLQIAVPVAFRHFFVCAFGHLLDGCNFRTWVIFFLHDRRIWKCVVRLMINFVILFFIVFYASFFWNIISVVSLTSSRNRNTCSCGHVRRDSFPDASPTPSLSIKFFYCTVVNKQAIFQCFVNNFPWSLV